MKYLEILDVFKDKQKEKKKNMYINSFYFIFLIFFKVMLIFLFRNVPCIDIFTFIHMYIYI